MSSKGTQVDERIVSMKFDNQQFERNVQTSLSTIEKLKNALNFNGASKGLEGIQSAANGVTMSPLTSAVEKVGLKFNAMYTIADQALRRIVDSAMAAGERIVKSLTIDPIKMGFSEYETQINAIQTILANTESKGTTLDNVNGALDELNAYADKTIYNFTEMTRNIGTFTAAGVDLDTSVSAIKGIANLAAVSGSTSQQASTAMYQLSQALASGTVKLMDWNSVVNAGMGGQVFQDALKETARVHGVAIDDLIEKEGSFRETLQHGWLSSEILTETLKKFTGDLTEEQLKSMGYTDAQIEKIVKMGQTANDAATKVKTFSQLFDTLKEAAQSGWTQTWEIIVGDFEEAREMLTKVSDVIGGILGESAEARNELLENWKVLGGRDDLIKAISNAFEALWSVVTTVKEAMAEVFPPLTAEKLKAFTGGLVTLTEKLKMSDGTLDKVKRTFKGLFAVLDIIRQVFVAVFKAVGSLFGSVSDLGGGVLEITASFGDWLVALNQMIKEGDVFNKIFTTIAAILKVAIKLITKFVKFIGEKFICPGFEFLSSILEVITDKISGVSGAAGDMGDKITSAFDALGNALDNSGIVAFLEALWNGIKRLAGGLIDAFGSFFGKLVEVAGEGNFSGVLDFINTLIAGGVGVALIKFFKNLSEPISKFAEMFEGIGGIFKGVGDVLQGWQSKLKAQALMEIAKALALLVAALFVVALIDEDKMYSALGGITVLFAEMAGVMFLLGKISDGIGSAKQLIGLASVMTTLGFSLLILSAAMKIMSTMSWEEMGIALISLVVGLGSLIAAVNLMPAKGAKNIKKVASALITMSISLVIMAAALKIMGSMSWEEMGIALISLVVGLGAMVAAANLLPKSKINGAATAIMKLSVALVILAAALKIMGSMSWEQMGIGLINLVTGLAAMAGVLWIIPVDAMVKVLALAAMAPALLALGAAMQMLGNMSWQSMGIGLINLVAGLAAMAGVLWITPADAMLKAGAFIALASGLVILAGALKIMGSMSWEQMGIALISMVGSLLALALGLNAMTGTIAGSAALMVACVALTMLVPPLLLLASMSWEGIAKGLVAIAGAFTIIGIAGYALSNVLPAILMLGGAMALMGVGILAAGVGLIAFGAGLTALAAGFTAIFASLDIIAVGIVKMVEAVVVGIIQGIANGIVKFCEAISAGAGAIAAAFKDVVLAICDVLVECVPAIVDMLLKVVSSILESLASVAPKIVGSLVEILIGVVTSLFNGLAEHVPDLMDSIINLVKSIFNSFISAFEGIDPSSLMKGILMLGLVAGLMAALAAVSALTPAAMIGVVGMGAVIAELAIVLAALGAFAQIPGLDWLINEGGQLLQSIGNALGGFIGGLAGGIAEGVTSSLPQIGTDLSNFMTNIQPFVEGASLIDSSMMDGVKSLAEVILLLTGANILEGLTSWFTGGSSLTKFGNELAAFGPNFRAYADSIAGVDPAVVEASANAAKSLAEMTSHIPNSGGVVSWFTGENSISKFGNDLISLGVGLKGFSDNVSGVNPETITAAANAAKVLAEMTAYIPNSGGVVSWFTGDNSISKFGNDLVSLGAGLKGFSDNVAGTNPETITAAANAAKTLAEMTAIIPNSGGVASWFAGDNSISKFGEDLKLLGQGLKGFSDQVTGVNPENIVAAANAAKPLSEITSIIPNQGGIASWFTGENSISKFGGELVSLGKGLKGFSDSIVGVNPENLTAAANAAKALAQMTQHIPNEGGIKSWFTGEASITKFSGELPKLGKGLKGFSDSVAGINAENLTAASNAAKAIADMTGTTLKNVDKIPELSTNLTTLGKGMKSCFSQFAGITGESITAAKNAVNAIDDITSIDSGKAQSIADALDDLTKSIKNLSSIPKNATQEFSNALSEMGKTSADSLLTAFKDIEPDMKSAGKDAVDAFVNGLKDKISAVESACKTVTKSASSAIGESKETFTSAGSNLVDGFANGISANAYKAEAKARAMAKAAAQAAEEELGIKSPSRVFYGIGDFAGQGFVNALSDYGTTSYKAGSEMGDSAKTGLSDAINKIRSIINGDIDLQPTIRPVLDLSDVRAGANGIGRLFDSETSIGVLSNVGAINASMKRYNQNGDTDQIVSEIGKLRKELSNNNHSTYNINGVNLSGDTEVEDAFKTILRAARIERRT